MYWCGLHLWFQAGVDESWGGGGEKKIGGKSSNAQMEGYCLPPKLFSLEKVVD